MAWNFEIHSAEEEVDVTEWLKKKLVHLSAHVSRAACAGAKVGAADARHHLSRAAIFWNDEYTGEQMPGPPASNAWVKEVFGTHEDFGEACRQVADRLNHVESTTSSGGAISSEAYHAKLIFTDANYEAAHFTLFYALHVG